jgi:hypothetical protein
MSGWIHAGLLRRRELYRSMSFIARAAASFFVCVGTPKMFSMVRSSE